MSDHDYDQDQSEESKASLKGKGWDILVGGKRNPFSLGGDDPFDKTRQPATDPDNPFAGQDDVEEILDSIAGTAMSDTGPLPPDAFWDRGKGSEAPEPSPAAGQTAERPPVDMLSPEDLGYQPAQPAAAAPTPIPPAPRPSGGQPPTPIASGVSISLESLDREPKPPQLPDEAFTPAYPAVPEIPATPPVDESPEPAAPSIPAIPPAPPVVPATPPPAPTSEGFKPFADHLPGEAGTPAFAPSGSKPPVSAPMSDSELDDLLIKPEIIDAVPPLSPRPTVGGQPVLPVQATTLRPYDPIQAIPLPTRRSAEPEVFPDPEMQKMLITPDRVNQLWEEINETFDYVVDDVRGHFNTTEQAIADLKKARELLMGGSHNYDNAEELLMQVKARLRLEEKVRQWSRTRGSWLGVYLVLWLILLAVGAFAILQAQETLAERIPEWIVGFWPPILFGGLGGVVGALWVLNEHIVKKRDFDPIHTPWYVMNPFLGMVLGFITYLVIRVGGGGLLVVAGVSSDVDFTSTSPALYLLCVVVGFQQNVLWSLLDRFVNLVFPEREDDKQAATDSTSSTSSSDSSDGPKG